MTDTTAPQSTSTPSLEQEIQATFQQAVAHHQAGQTQEAESLYRVILQIRQNHPDANHNLGMLLAQAQQPAAGLPYFEAALASNPEEERYWLSYIDTLILCGQADVARHVLALGRQHGLQGEAVEALAARLTDKKTENATGQPEAAKPTKSAKPAKQTKKSTVHRSAEPSVHEVNALVTLFNQGRYTDTEASARALTTRLPHHGFGWKVLGAALKQQGRVAEASVAMQKAVELMPGDAEAHNNLGIALTDQGKFSEAEASYRQALELKPNHAEAHYNLGNALQAQGRHAEAEAGFRQALKLKPGYAEAHYSLGNTLQTQGRHAEAAASYREVVKLRPDYAEAHNNLGVALNDQGLFSEAEASYRRALEFKPDYAEAHNNLGNTLKKQGRFSEAEAVYRRALELKPDFAEACNNLGITLKELDRLAEAEASYRRALKLKPDYAEAYNNLGITLRELSRYSEAADSYRHALELKPNFAEGFYNLGIVLAEQHHIQEAETSYRQALELKPDYAEAHNNLGNLLKEQDRLQEAEASYRQALEFKPGYAEIHNNLGITLAAQGCFPEAEANYRRALEIKPNFTEVYSNLGNTLKELDRLYEAEASYRRALELKPDYAEALYNLGKALKEQSRFSEAESSYRQALELKPDMVNAHSNLLFTLNYTASHAPSYCLEEAHRFGMMLDNKTGTRFSAWSCAPHPERLRVGVVSGDLGNHPVGYFLEGLLAHINPARIELIAYPTKRKEDELASRLRPRFAAWKPLLGHSDKAAARLVHTDGVHILLDLSGHTADNRLPVFTWKPAPVQVSWLGYFATTGVTEIDYLLGDPNVIPPEEEEHFTETVWRMPESYLCFTPPDVEIEVSALPAITNGCITFGCFNNLTKMGDEVVALWARVLQTVPGSRLFLKTKQLSDPEMCNTIRQRFSVWGIASERLVLEGYSPRAELLAAYHRVDIALDPFPYPGGTTSVEGLWMGVPVITRRGDRFISHVGESIARNAGLPDWIAADNDDYVSKAVAYSSDLGRLAGLRQGLRAQVLASPIFDAPRFARNFEAALWGMWQTWHDKQQKDMK